MSAVEETPCRETVADLLAKMIGSTLKAGIGVLVTDSVAVCGVTPIGCLAPGLFFDGAVPKP